MEKVIRVRLINDPTQVGFLTGRDQVRMGRRLLQVQFMDSLSWKPESQLEYIDNIRLSPLDMLESKKLGRPIDFRRTLTSVVAASEALSDFLEEVNVEQDRSGPIGPKWNDVPDTVFSLSRLAYPSELHEFVFERISFDPFPIKREPMIGSIRYGSPPSDLACGERMLMFEGDGYTRSYNLPRPLQMHPTDKPEVVASITSRI